MNSNKKMCAFALILGAVMSLSVFTYAASTATDHFSISLPVQQEDYELPAVKKTNSSKRYFCVDIESIGDADDTYSTVMVWTESEAGINFSPSDYEMGEELDCINYSTTPSVGTNVVLNMDNPIYTTNTPLVVGDWTPN